MDLLYFILDYQLGEPTIRSACSPRTVSISDAFSAFVYGYPSYCPRAHCNPNNVPTLRYIRRHGPVYTGHACWHLQSAVPWISEDRLLQSKEPKHSQNKLPRTQQRNTARPRAQELCESRGGRPRLPVPNKPDGFCGRKATLKGKAEPLNSFLRLLL